MSFHHKIILISLLILIGIPGAWFWYYRQTHPKYIPPPLRPEVTITIIPGWNLRQVAEYLVAQGFASSTQDVYDITGAPAVVRSRRAGSPTPDLMEGLDLIARNKSLTLSYEGYLAPETYRVFAGATLSDIIAKLLTQRNKEFLEIFPDQSDTSWPEVVTMASIIEKETRHAEDRALVADILWRRYQKGWALQVDSSVHYVADRSGDVFTTEKERAIDSPWNTYKYPGLPPGPICSPSIESITAALHPQTNDYWYFLSDKEGNIHYSRTFEEHSVNKIKYLR